MNSPVNNFMPEHQLSLEEEDLGYLLSTFCLKVLYVRAQSLSCVRLFSDSMHCSPPGSSVHRILQARILEWVATSCSRSSQPRDQTHVSCVTCTGSWIPYHWVPCLKVLGSGKCVLQTVQVYINSIILNRILRQQPFHQVLVSYVQLAFWHFSAETEYSAIDKL